jgi:proton-translocating NAD(P)+ transhydrogenase subunit alpha
MKTTWLVAGICGLLILAGTAAVQASPGPTDKGMTGHAAQSARSEGTAAQASGNEGGLGLLIFVFVLAIFLGFEMISKVPSQLHTPLMSGSNAISGITVVGALIATGTGRGTVMIVLGTLAVALAMINVVGGYLVTDRMLSMFKRKDRAKP